MANRKRAEARRKAQAKSGNGEGLGSQLKIWVALGVAVLLVGGIAFFVSRGDDSTANGDNPDTTEQPGSSFPDSQPVTIAGDALPGFDPDAAVDEAVGLEAPVLTGLNFQGDEVKIDAPSDGPYMVVFLAHWCPHCNTEVPRLLDWKNSGAVPAELQVVGVATAVAEGQANYPPATWFSNKGWSWPVLVDETLGAGTAGKAAVAYGASGWPYFVIVGADGLVKARVSGEIEAADLQVIVDNALAS